MLHIGNKSYNLGIQKGKILYIGGNKLGPIIPDEVPSAWYNWKTPVIVSVENGGVVYSGSTMMGYAYKDNVYVAITSTIGICRKSTDGRTWTNFNPQVYSGIAIKGNEWFGVEHSSQYEHIKHTTTPTADAWTSGPDFISGDWGGANAIACAANDLMAIITRSKGGTTEIWATSDLTVAPTLATTINAQANDGYNNTFCFSDVFYVIAGNIIARSSDGTNWSTFNFTIDSTSYNFGSLTCIENRLIASNVDGTVVAYSDDNGETWAIAHTFESSSATNSFVYTANGIVYFTRDGETKSYVSSDNGLSWQEINSIGNASRWLAVYNGSEMSVISGDTNYFVTSSFSSCYTLDNKPTTSSVVYDNPGIISELTVLEGGSQSITLSDNKIYNRNSSGDIII